MLCAQWHKNSKKKKQNSKIKVILDQKNEKA